MIQRDTELLGKWLDESAPGVARDLNAINHEVFFRERTIGFAGKERVRNMINQLRSALFPGVYERAVIEENEAGVLIGNSLRQAALSMTSLVSSVLREMCPDVDGTKPEECEECFCRAQEVTIEVLSHLPALRRMLQEDISAAYDGDPAAISPEEILLCYPSIEAVSVYRLAHMLYVLEVPVLPRMMSEYAHERTGIDIHPGATIGRAFFIDHGTGVVIGETCEIGDRVKLYQGVTLGARSFELDEAGNPVKGGKRHPNIESDVIIYPGATILGGDVTIGHHSVVGGNAWITHSIPPGSLVYNPVPSPTIKENVNANLNQHEKR